MNTRFHLFLIFSLFFGTLWGQETFPRNDVLDNRINAFAFEGATIVVEAGKKIENGVLLVKDGKIQRVGADVSIPKGYQRVDLTGKMIYPSFIDLHTSYGLPAEKKGAHQSSREQIPPRTEGAYNANDAIKSHYHAGDEFVVDNKAATSLRKIGFGAVLTLREDGIARGMAALATLGSQSPNQELISNRAAATYSLNRGTSVQNYPRSIMGYVALLKQTYYDAEWYKNLKHKPFSDQTLDAWIDQQYLPQLFDAGNWMNVLRADQVGDQFGVQYVIKGGGDEYQRIEEIKKTKASLIVPLNFPAAYDVSDPIDADLVSYEEMLHWEMAPTNPSALASNDIEIALTTAGLRKPEQDFLKNVRKAISNGLTKDQALRALTSTPAKLIKADMLGSIKAGKLANFLITTGEIFDKETKILENWIQGKVYEISEEGTPDYKGSYDLHVGAKNYELEIVGTGSAQKGKLMTTDSAKIDLSAKWDGDLVNFEFIDPNNDALVRLSGWKIDSGWKGTGRDENGKIIAWSANLTKANPDSTQTHSNDIELDSIGGQVIFPFTAYGKSEKPVAESMLIRNATVWTNEEEGILQNSDVLIMKGKIVQVGKSIAPPAEAKVIDGTNKHVTAGIIDEHTHIAGGGNDWATNSSMVRITDQLNSEDINMYRALAGGVTAAQVLHGSANPIGGQSAMIKLRWGAAPLDLKVKGADEFIKFALGENVKRSSNPQSIRYPKSRMGVEQVFVDAFNNARIYEKAHREYSVLSDVAKKKVDQPRRDLVDETMLEILNNKRFITCHSYVQSEINMLMKVAESFDFRVNTFTHILEGYKVADKMQAHGAAASTFSDWWNYKWEVRYAIPYNAAILQRAGVVTAMNSDDPNMGRRLNQEAAKAIKYGGLSEEEALKLVTLNPAKMLHLDDRMGSIKVGKDADLVIWTDNPLSVYAKAQKTIIDGAVYFDLDDDQQRRIDLEKDRARLIQKMLVAKGKGKPTQPAKGKQKMIIHCDSVHGLENDHAH